MKVDITKELEYKIIPADFESLEELYNHIKAEEPGFRPANLHEVTSFYIEKREIFVSGDIFVALGSPMIQKDKKPLFPFILGDVLSIWPFDWLGEKKYLGTREKVKLLLVEKEF